MAIAMSIAYYTSNIEDPSPDEWDNVPDNTLVMKPYGLFVKLSLNNIETLCPTFAPYISGANCKLFGFLPKTINGGFMLGGWENGYIDIVPNSTKQLTGDPYPISGWFSGQQTFGVLSNITSDSKPYGSGANSVSYNNFDNYDNFGGAWFAYGLSCYDSIDVTSLKTSYTGHIVWPGTFPWGGTNPIPTGVILQGWDTFKEYAYMDYEVCSKMPDSNYIGFDSVTVSGNTVTPKPGCLPFFTEEYAPLVFKVSFRGPNGERLEGTSYKTYGFANNHILNIYIKPDTGELCLYFYTNQSLGFFINYNASTNIKEETTAITTPHNVMSFIITPKTLSYSACYRPRCMRNPDSIVWEKSGSLDLNSVYYNVPKAMRMLSNASSTSSTQRFFPVSAPKEMQTYLPMLGLENSIGGTVPLPTPRATEKGYNFTGTWNATPNTWS